MIQQLNEKRLAASEPILDSSETQKTTLVDAATEEIQHGITMMSVERAEPVPGFLELQQSGLTRLRLRLQQAAVKALSSARRTTAEQPIKAKQTDSKYTVGESTLSDFAVNRKSEGGRKAEDVPRTESLDRLDLKVEGTSAWATKPIDGLGLKATSEFLPPRTLKSFATDVERGRHDLDIFDSGSSLRLSIENAAPIKDRKEVGKPLLVLDLDETLIHSSLIPRKASDFWIEVIQNHDIRTREVFWVYKRPGVDAFLAEISKFYVVYVFTAGIREYASQILDRLDPNGTMIKGRLYRDECTEIRGQGSYAKDLTKISENLERVLLVDNTPACFSLQPSNGLPIKSWYTDTTDKQLFRLRDFLIGVADAPDMRSVLSGWSIH